MQLIEDFEPMGEFEALGRHSKEELKHTESDISESRATSSSVDADLSKTLAERAKKAEALVTMLKEELTESENVQSKLNLKLERLQNQIDMLNGVKQENDIEILPSPPLSTPSHLSSPFEPTSSSKRKQGPVPSLEQVTRKKAKISKPGLGERKRYLMSDLSGSERLVVKDTRALVGILVATEDAYPDISGRQEKLARESWAKVSMERQLQVEFTKAVAFLSTRALTKIRNKVKSVARSLVQTLFGISQNSTKLQTRKQDPVKRTGIYRHPSIQTIVNMTWFRNGADEGPTHAEFSDGGNGIPLSTIALTLTAIHGALDEWVTGQREDVEFRSQLYQEHYIKHLAGLKALEKHTAKEQIVPRLRKHWLKTALNFARAIRPSMDTSDSNTHLTTIDFEAAKAEWKDLDLDEDDL